LFSPAEPCPAHSFGNEVFLLRYCFDIHAETCITPSSHNRCRVTLKNLSFLSTGEIFL